MSSDYQYDPRPPKATPDDQIHYHVWFMLVNAPCSEAFLYRKLGICPKSWLLNHRCIEPLMTKQQRMLSRVPKKDSPWLKCSQDVEDAWGIYTQHVPRFGYALAYQILFLAGPLIFSLVWPLSGERYRKDGSNPRDLQNPIVPLSLSIGLLGTFWTWWQVFFPLAKIQSPYFTEPASSVDERH